MILKRSFVSSSLLVFITLCVPQLVLAESDLELLRKEVKEQRERLINEIANLQQLEQRLNAAIQNQENNTTGDAAASSKTEKEVTAVASATPDVLAPETFPLPEREPIVGVSEREELYGSFSDNGFAKSVPMFGSDWRFSFGGYVKLDVLHDFDGTGDKYQFITATIPVEGAPGPQPGSYTNIHARETRFSFEVRNAREGLPFNKAFLEMDFYDESNTAPRLRHAYVQWGNLVAGQTWTTLTMQQQLPFMLDFAYGDALYGGRTAQLRWEQKIDDNWSWATAIEDWSDDAVSNPYEVSGEARSDWPLFVLRGNYGWDHGSLSLGTNIGQVRWNGTDGVGDDSEIGWGVVGGGRLYLDSENKHYLGFAGSYSHGTIVNTINLAEGSAVNALLRPDGTVDLLKSWNAHIALHYEFSRHWSTNWSVAYGGTNPDDTLFPNALKASGAVHANLIWHLAPEFLVGAEYMVGERENANGADGIAQRIQFSTMYSF